MLRGGNLDCSYKGAGPFWRLNKGQNKDNFDKSSKTTGRNALIFSMDNFLGEEIQVSSNEVLVSCMAPPQ